MGDLRASIQGPFGPLVCVMYDHGRWLFKTARESLNASVESRADLCGPLCNNRRVPLASSRHLPGSIAFWLFVLCFHFVLSYFLRLCKAICTCPCTGPTCVSGASGLQAAHTNRLLPLALALDRVPLSNQPLLAPFLPVLILAPLACALASRGPAHESGRPPRPPPCLARGCH